LKVATFIKPFYVGTNVPQAWDIYLKMAEEMYSAPDGMGQTTKYQQSVNS